jgi:hypothetical protein
LAVVVVLAATTTRTTSRPQGVAARAAAATEELPGPVRQARQTLAAVAAAEHRPQTQPERLAALAWSFFVMRLD